MAELKTKPTRESVNKFLAAITDKQKRDDCLKIVEVLKEATKADPKIWGTKIVGFGDYHYRSERTGREGDWFMIGFSPRKDNITLYFLSNLSDHADLLSQLGKHKRQGGCLHFRRLEDVNMPILKKLTRESIKAVKAIMKSNSTVKAPRTTK